MSTAPEGGAQPAPKEPAPNATPNDKPAEHADSPAATETPERASATVGRGIAAAAANPGNTRARNAQRDQARQNLEGGMVFDADTVLNGDAVVGGKHIYYQATSTRPEVRATELSAAYVDSYLDTYVDLPGWQTPKATEPVIILRGAPGSGRYATALHMLGGLRRRRTIWLHPGTVFEALASDRITDDAGYLLDSRDGNEVNGFELQRLDGEFGRRGCVLIITVSDRCRPAELAVAERIVDIGCRPDPLAVVRKHLAWHCRRLGRPEVVVDDKQILGLLPENATGISGIALLGKLLADENGNEDTVRRHLGVRDSHDFETWFDGLPHLYAQCFAISLAVLHAQPHEAVADAARALEALLDPKEQRQKRPKAPEPFLIGRKRLLEEVRASATERTVETRHGRMPAEVITFLDAQYPVKLLRSVWQEHDQVRGELVAWLSLLGRSRSVSIRVAAATAVGRLAQANFDYMRANVLLGWAGHEHDLCRESAAIALERPAASGELRATVTSLVSEWAAGDDAKLAATAARTCGTALGSHDMDTAVALLDELIVQESGAVVDAACVSLAEWVGGSDSGLRNHGIAAMHGWSVNRDPVRRTNGQLAFLLVAADLIAEGDPWPTLLRLSTEDPGISRQVVAMWSAALANPELSEISRQVLTAWAIAVDRDRHAITGFVELFSGGGTRTRSVLNYQARTWLKRKTDPQCRSTAAAVLNTAV